MATPWIPILTRDWLQRNEAEKAVYNRKTAPAWLATLDFNNILSWDIFICLLLGLVSDPTLQRELKRRNSQHLSPSIVRSLVFCRLYVVLYGAQATNGIPSAPFYVTIKPPRGRYQKYNMVKNAQMINDLTSFLNAQCPFILIPAMIPGGSPGVLNRKLESVIQQSDSVMNWLGHRN